MHMKVCVFGENMSHVRCAFIGDTNTTHIDSPSRSSIRTVHFHQIVVKLTAKATYTSF